MPRPLTIALLLPLCLAVSACGGGARPEQMASTTDSSFIISKNNRYYKSIAVSAVSGGMKADGLPASAALAEALRRSLDSRDLLSESDAANYTLEAKLLSLEQPRSVSDYTVRATIAYTLRKNHTPLLTETILSSGGTGMRDTLSSPDRLRVANETAIKNNIEMFLSLVMARS